MVERASYSVLYTSRHSDSKYKRAMVDIFSSHRNNELRGIQNIDIMDHVQYIKLKI